MEYISLNPEAGDLIVGGKGAGKVRWTAGRSGKSAVSELLLITSMKTSFF